MQIPAELARRFTQARSVLVLTGAGVSAESGVPTFRGGGNSAVWKGIPFDVISSAEMLERDLPVVWEWFDYRRNFLGAILPNEAHYEIARWHELFPELTVVTQNIDGLHQKAGSRDVIEVPDCEADDRHSKAFDQEFGFKTKSLLCVPILEASKPKAHGVIQLINPEDPFMPEEIAVVQQIAQRLQPVPIVQASKLEQPFPVKGAAALDRDRLSHLGSRQVNHREGAPGPEQGFRCIGQREDRAVALESVRFPKPSHQEVRHLLHRLRLRSR